MRCRSTKEAGDLVERVLPEARAVERWDHAAIAMMRSRTWAEIPIDRAERGCVKRRGLLWYQHTDRANGEIPWR